MELVLSNPLKRLFSSLVVVAFLFPLFLFHIGDARAQSADGPAGGAGVNISPAIIEPNQPLEPGTSNKFSVTLKNIDSGVQTFYISSKDIVDVKDGGTPVFANGTEEKTGMELSAWMKLPVTQVTLAPGVSEEINFTIDVPENATPGSHFGSVFLSVDPPDIKHGNGAMVGYKVANIITVRIAGDAISDANIRQFSTDRFFNSTKNIDFSARIENNGSILVRPVGPVEIRNMLGQKVDTIIFNEEQQSAVFPGKVREFKFNWTGQGAGFGRYEAILSPVYGEEGAKKTMSSTVTFWILPIKIIGPALAGLAFILLITFLFVRIYIKRTLAHLSHGQSRIVSRRKSKGLSSSLLLVVVMLTVTAIFVVILLALFA
jgi:hypothetical protein